MRRQHILTAVVSVNIIVRDVVKTGSDNTKAKTQSANNSYMDCLMPSRGTKLSLK